MSWEIYGDWVEDQSKLVTDIYFLLWSYRAGIASRCDLTPF